MGHVSLTDMLAGWSEGAQVCSGSMTESSVGGEQRSWKREEVGGGGRGAPGTHLIIIVNIISQVPLCLHPGQRLLTADLNLNHPLVHGPRYSTIYDQQLHTYTVNEAVLRRKDTEG